MIKFKSKRFKLLLLGIIIIIVGLIVFYLKADKNNEIREEISIIETKESTTKNTINNYIDIKGSVINPGVYEFKENDRVIDAINMAGGLTNDANTSNINLSQKLKSEMVIYVYNNNEIKNNTVNLTCDNICKTEIIEVNNCIEVTTPIKKDNESDIVNINTASLEELMTVSGIGESKAKNIIEYRSTNGKFNTIEDIKNISGIGESLFNKIKDKIKV